MTAVAAPRRAALALLFAGVVALAGLYAVVLAPAPEDDLLAAGTADAISRVPAADGTARALDLVEWAVLGVFRALERGGDAHARDVLQDYAQPAVIEAVLAEAPALRDTGLAPPAEAVHELEFLAFTSRQSGNVLNINAEWRVVGLIDPETHAHMLGHVYTATLALERGRDRWALAGFDLTDVTSEEAGTVVQN